MHTGLELRLSGQHRLWERNQDAKSKGAESASRVSQQLALGVQGKGGGPSMVEVQAMLDSHGSGQAVGDNIHLLPFFSTNIY